MRELGHDVAIVWAVALAGITAGSCSAQEPRGAGADVSSVPAFLVAAPAEDRSSTVGLFGEELRLRAWLDLGDNRARVEADPLAIHGFNALGLGRGGPVAAGLRWYPRVFRGGSPGDLKLANRSWGAATPPADVCVVRLWDTAGPDHTRFSGGRSVEFVAVDLGLEHFTGEDLLPLSVMVVPDDAGRPGLIYSIVTRRGAAMKEFAKSRLRRSIVQCVDGYAVGAPEVISPILGSAMVTGAFEKQALETFVGRIRAGELTTPTRALAASEDAVRGVAGVTRVARIRTSAAQKVEEGVLAFDELAAWASADVEGVARRRGVTLIGVPLPLCEENDSIDFLLIPSLWECAFGMPPPPDQVVHVTVRSDPPFRAVDLRGRVVRVEGRLTRRSEPAPDASSSRAATHARFRMDSTSLQILD